MNYVFANVGLCMLLAGLVGFLTACLAGWALFRQFRGHMGKVHGAQVEVLQNEIAEAKDQHRLAEAAAQELKGANEANDAKLRALQAKLRTQEDSSKSELQEKTAEVALLRKQLEDDGAAEKIRDLEGKLSTLASDKEISIRTLTSDLSRAHAAKQALEDELADHKQTMATWEAHYSGLSNEQGAKVKDLELKLDEAQALVGGLREQANAAENQAREMEREVRKMIAMREEEFKAMQGQTVAAAEAQKRFESSTAEIRAEAEARNVEIEKLRKALEAGSPRVAELEQELAAVRANLAERNEAISRLEADAALLSHLRHAMRERQTQIDGLQLQLAKAKEGSEHSVLETQLSELQQQLAARDTTIRTLESNLREATAQMAQRNESMARLEADAALLSHLRHAMRERQTQIDGLKLQLTQAKAGSEHAELETRLGHLQEQLSMRDTAIRNLEANLREANTQMAERNETMARLESDAALLSHLRHAMRERQTQIDGLKLQLAQVETLRAQVADREEQIQAWDQRYQTTVGEMHAEHGRLQLQIQELQQQQQAVKPMAFAAAAGAASSSAVLSSTTVTSTLRLEPQGPDSPELDVNELQARLRLVSLRGIQFLPDSDEILPESNDTLEHAYQALTSISSDARIEIGGHTDSWGEPAHNRELSLRRAKAVRRYLVDRGIHGAMLIATGYGELRPIADNETPDGRFANRRIEFQVRGSVR